MDERDEERDWIEQSRQGDAGAFEHLVRRYQRMLHALAYRMTGSLDEAEDLAQETFVQAYHQLDTFRAESKFSSWLYRIAVNLCLNWQKRNARRQQVYRQWSEEQTTDPPVDSSIGQRVQEALLRLPAPQRAALVLTVYEGLNHAEAARLLGCSETTVSWRVFAARARLKRLLKNAVEKTSQP